MVMYSTSTKLAVDVEQSSLWCTLPLINHKAVALKPSPDPEEEEITITKIIIEAQPPYSLQVTIRL